MPIVIDFTTSFRFVFLGMLTRLKSLSFSKACVNIMLNNPPNDFERNILQYSLSLMALV